MFYSGLQFQMHTHKRIYCTKMDSAICWFLRLTKDFLKVDYHIFFSHRPSVTKQSLHVTSSSAKCRFKIKTHCFYVTCTQINRQIKIAKIFTLKSFKCPPNNFFTNILNVQTHQLHGFIICIDLQNTVYFGKKFFLFVLYNVKWN